MSLNVIFTVGTLLSFLYTPLMDDAVPDCHSA
jgi:hypothetical protein